MKYCPYCGKEYSNDVSFCDLDGNPLQSFEPALTQAVQRVERCQGSRFISICEAVSKVNERFPEYTFGVDRAVIVNFRGHDICLIFGPFGSFAPAIESPGWSNLKALYAVAESQEQITWMAHDTDAFKPVRDDATFPIFWIKEPSLRRIAEAVPLSPPFYPPFI